MIEGFNPVFQALLGTLLTWGLTAAGSAVVFVVSSGKRWVLDTSLGFAAGVMIAASYWSLLSPAIELAENSGNYGENGEYSFVPAAVGFVAGALFILAADVLMPHLGAGNPTLNLAMSSPQSKKDDGNILYTSLYNDVGAPDVQVMGADPWYPGDSYGSPVLRKKPTNDRYSDYNSFQVENSPQSAQETVQKNNGWKRILLLIIAITVHNIPEGLAVGVGFGAIGKTPSATFERARNLAVGIGIQNFPEGLAVSLPLKGAGYSRWRSFWYGQLSGMVEPVAGVLGALLVGLAEPILPYALAFAAGAMIYVVVDDIIPEANTCGNGRLASWGAVVGFAVMMVLDVSLG